MQFFPNKKNGGEIPRRSVDQGLSTSPKSTTVDLFYVNYKRIIQKSQLLTLICFTCLAYSLFLCVVQYFLLFLLFLHLYIVQRHLIWYNS